MAQMTSTAHGELLAGAGQQQGDSARAQQAGAKDNRRISVDFRDIRLKTAIRRVAKDADVAIFYNDRDIPADERVSVQLTNALPVDVLRILLRDSGLRVRTIAAGVVIEPTESTTDASSPDTSGVITGIVVDSASKVPVSDATVTLDGTRLSARTNEAGAFEIRDVAPGAYVAVVRRLGYGRTTERLTVGPGQTTSVTVELVATPRVLDQVLTTATGEHRRVELGNAIDAIHADSVVEAAPVTSLSEILATRVAGLQVYFAGGLTGASPQINVRGQNSLSLTNQPLLYIDGVRVDNGAAGGVAGPVYAGPSAGRFDDLVPSEIESIEVVKGPSAATLYGTDAANGVILIRTKRGTAGPPSWKLFAEGGLLTIDRSRFRTNYFPWGHTTSGDPSTMRCTIASVAAGACVQDSTTSFSPLLDPETTPLGSGSRYSVGAQVSGGSGVRYFLSGTMQREIGYLKMPDADRTLLEAQAGHELGGEALNPNASSRYAGRANFTIPLATTLDAALGIGLSSARARIPNPLAISSADGGGGIRDQTDGWSGGARPGDLFSKRNRQNVTRLTTSLTANWRPASWLRARITAGLDRSSEFDDRLARAGEGFLPPTVRGARDNTKITTSLQTLDASSTLDAQVSSSTSSRTTVGVQYNRTLALLNTAAAQQLTPGSGTVAGGALPIARESTVESVVAGAYAEQAFGFNDRLYATIAVRADGSSAFGSGFKTAIYPKTSVSWLLSDEEFWPDISWLTSLRVRAAYGQSGVQPGPVAALATETLFPAFVSGAPTTGAGLGNLGNSNLKPERQREIEVGLDLQALGGRVELGVTRYDKRSTDALVSLPLPASLGAGTYWENVGEVRNWGYEAALTLALVQRHSLQVSVSLNGSLNDNRVIRIAPGVDRLYQQSFPSIVSGQPLFSYFDYPIVHLGDDNGNGILEASEIAVGGDLAFAGRSYPRTQLSGTTAIGLLGNRVRISASIEHRGGFSMLDPEWISCITEACASVSFVDAPFRDQAAAQARRTASLHNTLWGFIRDASFTRLRELSLSYAITDNLARALGVQGAAISLSARNLALWTRYSGVDPEVQSFFGRSDRGAGYDRSGPPAPTYWLLRLQLRP